MSLENKSREYWPKNFPMTSFDSTNESSCGEKPFLFPCVIQTANSLVDENLLHLLEIPLWPACLKTSLDQCHTRCSSGLKECSRLNLPCIALWIYPGLGIEDSFKTIWIRKFEVVFHHGWKTSLQQREMLLSIDTHTHKQKANQRPPPPKETNKTNNSSVERETVGYQTLRLICNRAHYKTQPWQIIIIIMEKRSRPNWQWH